MTRPTISLRPARVAVSVLASIAAVVVSVSGPSADLARATAQALIEGVDPALVAELQAAFDVYDEAWAASHAAPMDATHPMLLDATTDNELRRNVQAEIVRSHGRGQAWRPGADGVVLKQTVIEVEPSNDSRAFVVTCWYNVSELYVVASGEVIDGKLMSGHNRLLFERGDDSRWRLALGGSIDEGVEVEANPC